MKTGLARIIDCAAHDNSAAMQALYDHACDWLLTVDCLADYDGITLADAVRIADAGFRGDDSHAAKRVLATLNAKESK